MIPCSYLLQKVSEKVGGAEGTKLDDDFKEMERVSVYFSAFPWCAVVPCKGTVELFCTRVSKCSVSLKNMLPSLCIFKQKWKARCLPWVPPEARASVKQHGSAPFLKGFIVTCLNLYGAELQLHLSEVGMRDEKMENDVSNLVSLWIWLQWTSLLGGFQPEASQNTEERAVWESSWPGLHSTSTTYCKSPVFVQVSIFKL